MTTTIKQQKAAAIIDSVKNTGNAVKPLLKKAYPRKMPLKRAYGRYRKARKEKRTAQAMARLIVVMGVLNITRIIEQPAPRFKPGAMMRDRAPEIIELPIIKP